VVVSISPSISALAEHGRPNHHVARAVSEGDAINPERCAIRLPSKTRFCVSIRTGTGHSRPWQTDASIIVRIVNANSTRTV